MHSSLIGCAKIHLPYFKNVPEILPVPTVVVFSATYNILSSWNQFEVFRYCRFSVIIRDKINRISIWLLGTFCQKKFLPDLNKKKFLKLIWCRFSLLDFLQEHSLLKLRDLLKSFGLLTHF